jgi:N-methylhydantoinase B
MAQHNNSTKGGIMIKPTKKIDPVIFEILHHKLWQITNEMGISLTRLTGSTIVSDAKDYATGLYRADGDLLMINCGVLYHAVTIPYGIKYIMDKYGQEPGIAEGDIFIINDPYVCALHVADMLLLMPIYYKGELVSWSGIMSHLMDIGGIDTGGMCPRAREVWQEGIRLPGLKIMEKGKIRKDVWDALLNMVRDPGMVGLDLRGMIAASNVAAERLTELIANYGLDTYKALAEEVIRYAELRMRARLLELPNGTWQTRVYYDDDGVTDRVYQVVIKMTKDKDTLIFDLTGTSEQAPSFINCGVKGAQAGVFGAVAPLIAYDIPWSQGVTNCIRVIAPTGTLVNPHFPAPCSLGTIAACGHVMSGVVELVAKMFVTSEKYRQDFTAMWGPMVGGAILSGIGQHSEYVVDMFSDEGGTGAGARSYADGVNSAGVVFIPEVVMANAETYELGLPVLYLFRREATDSGGAGKWRGGDATEHAAILHDAPQGQLMVTHGGTGVKAPITSGLFGGYPSANFHIAVKRNTDVQEKLKSGEVPQLLDELEGTLEMLPASGVTQLTNGDVLWLRCHGGGGYGDPLDRDFELVRSDVADRYVSVQAAKDVYGVVINPVTLEVDTKATEARRQQIKENRFKAKKEP